jgi:hypothetical protein
MTVSHAAEDAVLGGERMSDGLWTHRGKLVVRGGPLEGAIRTKVGAPVDADFAVPVDGLMMLDTSTLRLYVRSGGVWKSVVLA